MDRDGYRRGLTSAMTERERGTRAVDTQGSKPGGIKEGFPEEGIFGSGLKDELVFTRWRKDVCSFIQSFILHPFPEASLGPAPLLGNAEDPEKSLTLPCPQGAPRYGYHDPE